MSKRDLLIGAGALLLLAVAIVRTAVPDRSRIRRLSVEAFEIRSEPIKQGETIEREARWDAPVDVYVLAWEPWIGAKGSAAELFLIDGSTRIFGYQDSAAPSTALPLTAVPTGSGYLIQKGKPLVLRLRITNTGPPTETRGARAHVYFVPVEGN